MSDQNQGTWTPQQQQPGQPAQPGYGQPAYGATPYPPAAPQTNGFATAGLILGILPTGVLGVIFSILGLVRAAKVGVGKAKSWIGLILSVLWIVGFIALFVAVANSDTVKNAVAKTNARLDTGCVAVETNLAAKSTALQSATTPEAQTAAIQSIVDELKADEAKTKVPAAKAAMETFQADLESLAAGLQSGNVDPALATKLETDGAAIDTACGA